MQQRLGARMLPVQWSAASIRLHRRMYQRHKIADDAAFASQHIDFSSDEDGNVSADDEYVPDENLLEAGVASDEVDQGHGVEA